MMCQSSIQQNLFTNLKIVKGPFIKDVINQGGGGGFAKRWSY